MKSRQTERKVDGRLLELNVILNNKHEDAVRKNGGKHKNENNLSINMFTLKLLLFHLLSKQSVILVVVFSLID